MLPDSGGLVLPLANGGFLVGLFIVERLAASSGGGGNSGAGALPPPPAGSMFGPQDVQLIKQSAAVLALACAMDLRSVLERAGNAVRQRQLRGLVRQASSARGQEEGPARQRGRAGTRPYGRPGPAMPLAS